MPWCIDAAAARTRTPPPSRRSPYCRFPNCPPTSAPLPAPLTPFSADGLCPPGAVKSAGTPWLQTARGLRVGGAAPSRLSVPRPNARGGRRMGALRTALERSRAWPAPVIPLRPRPSMPTRMPSRSRRPLTCRHDSLASPQRCDGEQPRGPVRVIRCRAEAAGHKQRYAPRVAGPTAARRVLVVLNRW